MSAAFYITPTKPDAYDFNSDMDINLNEFVAGLKRIFPDIYVYSQETSHMIVHWELNWVNGDSSKDCMWGEMSNNRLWVYLDAHSKRETIAKFATWYRSLVPEIYQLYVAPSWSMDSFELSPNMNEADIIRSLHKLES